MNMVPDRYGKLTIPLMESAMSRIRLHTINGQRAVLDGEEIPKGHLKVVDKGRGRMTVRCSICGWQVTVRNQDKPSCCPNCFANI